MKLQQKGFLDFANSLVNETKLFSRKPGVNYSFQFMPGLVKRYFNDYLVALGESRDAAGSRLGETVNVNRKLWTAVFWHACCNSERPKGEESKFSNISILHSPNIGDHLIRITRAMCAEVRRRKLNSTLILSGVKFYLAHGLEKNFQRFFEEAAIARASWPQVLAVADIDSRLYSPKLKKTRLRFLREAPSLLDAEEVDETIIRRLKRAAGLPVNGRPAESKDRRPVRKSQRLTVDEVFSTQGSCWRFL